MNEIESLVEILKHWQIHETENAVAYRLCAQRAHALDLSNAGNKLEQIAVAADKNRRLFAEALALMTIDEGGQKNNAMTLPILPISGDVSIPERLAVLDASQRSAVLATSSDAHPYTSLIGFALTPDFKGALFVTTKNTLKYRNLIKSSHAALLIDNRTNMIQDLINAEAVTLIGKAKILHKGKRRDELLKIFLKKHPTLRTFAEAKTTALVLIEAERYIHVSGFQSVTVWELKSQAQ